MWSSLSVSFNAARTHRERQHKYKENFLRRGAACVGVRNQKRTVTITILDTQNTILSKRNCHATSATEPVFTKQAFRRLRILTFIRFDTQVTEGETAPLIRRAKVSELTQLETRRKRQAHPGGASRGAPIPSCFPPPLQKK